MLFVDGENLTIRGQEVVAANGMSLDSFPSHYEKDAFVWFPRNPAEFGHCVHNDIFEPRLIRAYYYTSVQGSEDKQLSVRERLRGLGFDPQVFKKEKARGSKGVDITLTKDMLSHGFHGHYDVAILVAGDGDYLPLIEEVKRLGRRVFLAFFVDNGLNPNVRLAADHFFDITKRFIDDWKNRLPRR